MFGFLFLILFLMLQVFLFDVLTGFSRKIADQITCGDGVGKILLTYLIAALIAAIVLAFFGMAMGMSVSEAGPRQAYRKMKA